MLHPEALVSERFAVDAALRPGAVFVDDVARLEPTAHVHLVDEAALVPLAVGDLVVPALDQLLEISARLGGVVREQLDEQLPLHLAADAHLHRHVLPPGLGDVLPHVRLSQALVEDRVGSVGVPELVLAPRHELVPAANVPPRPRVAQHRARVLPDRRVERQHQLWEGQIVVDGEEAPNVQLDAPDLGGDELGGLLTLLEVRIAQFPGDGDDHHGCPWVTARFWTRGFQFGRFWRADWLWTGGGSLAGQQTMGDPPGLTPPLTYIGAPPQCR